MADFALLAGRVIAVTGAASGIGRACAVAAAQAGARAVIAADLRETPREGGPSVREKVEEAGAAFRFVSCDVSRRADAGLITSAAVEFGGLDGMVCNAGIALRENFLTISEADYRRITAVNLDGAFFTAQAAANQMVAGQKRGAIVMMSSMGGLRGSAITTVYSTTKGGVSLMTSAMADTLGPLGIRVNAVCPGVINTHLAQQAEDKTAILAMVDRSALKRIGQPEEVAAAVVWLLSDLSSYVTGVSIPVDGGICAVL